MVRVATYFAMSLGAFILWQAMEKLHVWIALHPDEMTERMEKAAEIKRVREELLRQVKEKDLLQPISKAVKTSLRRELAGEGDKT